MSNDVEPLSIRRTVPQIECALVKLTTQGGFSDVGIDGSETCISQSKLWIEVYGKLVGGERVSFKAWKRFFLPPC